MSYDYLPQLANRVARLERRNQLLMLLLFASLGAALLIRFPYFLEQRGFAAPSNESADEQLLTVKGLRVVDEEGTERAVLRTRDGAAVLQFKDPSGKVRGFLASGDNGGCMLGFHDKGGKPRTLVSESSIAVGKGASFAVLRALDSGTVLNLIQDGKARLNLKAGKGEHRTGVFVADVSGAIRLGMGLVLDSPQNNRGFEPGMIIQDKKNVRLSMGLSPSAWNSRQEDAPAQLEPRIYLVGASGKSRMVIHTGYPFGPNILFADESGKIIWNAFLESDDFKREVAEKKEEIRKRFEKLTPEEIERLFTE